MREPRASFPLPRLVAAALAVLLAGGVAILRWDDRGPSVLPEQVRPRAVPKLAKRLPESRRLGVDFAGLREVTSGRCAGGWQGIRSGRCLHGPDPAPPGVDVTASRPPASSVGRTQAQAVDEQGPGRIAVPATSGVFCDGDGASGKRVQAIYARASDRPDRYGTYLGSILTWAANVEYAFDQSAAKTGGSRHVRWVTDAACNLSVLNIVLPPSGDDSIDTTTVELERLGHSRSDRMYLVWMDANVYCGIATLWLDDQPGQTNANNSGPSIGRVDSGCWGLWPSVEAHELMHTLGAVQQSAPHSTGGHCTDENDRMCYADGSGLPLLYLCSDAADEALFDCNADDYFNTSPFPGTYIATHWNVASSSFLTGGPAPVLGQFTPLDPARILDTRDGTGGVMSTPVAAGQTVDVPVSGRGGVPSSGASAVVLNVTVTDVPGGGYATLWPSGAPRPLASNLNFGPGQTVANLVVARLGSGGRVSLGLEGTPANVIFDVAGWYSSSTGAPAGRYRALTPARILDTREGNGAPLARVGPGRSVEVQVTGRGSVPSSGVSAVVLNATAVGPSAPGYLTVYPTGGAVPLASNLNFSPGQTVPNRVFARLGTGGKVSVYNATGSADILFDVVGWFTDLSGTSSPPGTTAALSPVRILDTRTGAGGLTGPLASGRSYDVTVAGRGGVPASGVGAVIANVTVTQPTANAYLTVFPSGTPPVASDLNFVAGQTVPNLVVAKLASDGRFRIQIASGTAQVIVDVVGYIT